VDCKSIGSGEKALIYLGRYLYRSVIREKDIVSCKDGLVSFRYQLMLRTGCFGVPEKPRSMNILP
jgi:hypothetical protein